MPRYLLSVHMADGEAREAMTDEQMQHSWQEIQAHGSSPAACTTPTRQASCVSPVARW